MTQQALAERYGRGPGARRRTRLIAVVAAVGVLLVTGAWVLWVGLLSPKAALETRDLGYADRGADVVEVRFEVSVDPGVPVSCALQALNEQFAIVGWRIVEIPASTDRTRRFAEEVRVTEPAVTGLIYRCWTT